MSDLTTEQIDQIHAAVERVRDGFAAGVLTDLGARDTQLRQLRRMLVEQQEAFTAALHADLGKPPFEAYGTEIGFMLGEIDHAISQLRAWNHPVKVKVPMTLKPGAARIVPEPLGTVLVVAPWNYPLQLLLAPLVPAIAAGNTAVLKPSEIAPATAAAVAEHLPRYLDGRAVSVVTGGVPETTELLRLPFDHIFYTGNGNVAKIVMRAAAEHLTPVTLELGGKSPVIVAADADVDVAARRIVWGKFVNAGQTCVAPDYVLVDERIEDALLGAMLRAVHDFYGDDPSHSPDYARIVNEHHHDRLTALLDAGGYDATVTGGPGDRTTRYLPPTILAGVKPDAAVMQGEIFGPILPVLTVSDVDDAVRFVNARPKPLALYVFTGDDAVGRRVTERTTSGGACVNHVVLHLAIAELPFGGVGPSGIGAYHGKAGFDTFSHRKSVLVKPTRPDPPVMYPPYKKWKEKIIRRMI
jgi:aldehyde dehydrogenase (NAD+)